MVSSYCSSLGSAKTGHARANHHKLCAIRRNWIRDSKTGAPSIRRPSAGGPQMSAGRALRPARGLKALIARGRLLVRFGNAQVADDLVLGHLVHDELERLPRALGVEEDRLVHGAVP